MAEQYPILTQEQASTIAQAVQLAHRGPAWPVEPSLYIPAELFEKVKTHKLLDYATGELRRRLVMLNEKNNGISTLADLVLDLHQALVVKLNNNGTNPKNKQKSDD